jgi:hypothetical protein
MGHKIIQRTVGSVQEFSGEIGSFEKSCQPL